MRIRIVGVLCCFALAGCSALSGGVPLPSGVAGSAQDRAQPGSYGAYQSLYSFTGGSSGGNPEGGLVAYGGELYGTTNASGRGYGTVFAISTSGDVRVLHSFAGPPDGESPAGRLVVAHGRLYGTTMGGGTHGGGTAFVMTRSGDERILHNFGGAGDGIEPDAGLVTTNGVFYGTTRNGGSHDKGTVFVITPSGTEHVLHSFSGTPDAGHPSTGLTIVKGEFYGTTRAGGRNDAGGAAFKIDAFGDERVIHSFGVNRGDGANPAGDLIFSNGLLYGTTIHGGAVGSGFGTVFEMNTGGKEFVLHSFGLRRDGAYPFAGLVSFGGAFYGTTESGGDTPQNEPYCIFYGGADAPVTKFHQCGTLFRISRFGQERVLYRFRGYPDGSNPVSKLVSYQGVLYGTAYWGGSSKYFGTVFRLFP